MAIVITAASAAYGHARASTDESAIRAARDRSNRAIAAHDLDTAAAIWSKDYVGVSSGNGRAIGRDEERSQFAELIATRPRVVYVRTPQTVTVNTSWGQAGESGRWSGSWSAADGETRVGGVYFAKWKNEDGAWRIIAETFVQTMCSGTHYCDAPPTQPR
jgi:ketosteroid isomerase-like protein